MLVAAQGQEWTRSDYLGIVSIVVSVVGFWIAVSQIRKTRDAAMASEQARLDSGRSYLRVLMIPEMRQRMSELDTAILLDDRTAVTSVLDSYSHLAAQVSVLIRELKLDRDDAAEQVASVARLAADTKRTVGRVKRGSLESQTREVREKMDATKHRMAEISLGGRPSVTEPKNEDQHGETHIQR